jgi:hypothetical protein
MKKYKIEIIEYIEGGFGWKLVDMTEVNYFCYPECDRLWIESKYKELVNAKKQIYDYHRKEMYYYLTDETYRWLVQENLSFPTQMERLKYLDKRDSVVHEQFRKRDIIIGEEVATPIFSQQLEDITNNQNQIQK